MRESGKAVMSGTYEEFAKVTGCFPDEAKSCIDELKRYKTADVTLRNDGVTVNVTLKSRKYARELKAKELSNLRVKKFRSNANVTHDVTPEKRLLETSNKKLETNKEEKERRDTSPKAPSQKKGTRLPDQFFLTLEMKSYAAEKRPDIDIKLETEKFCNYFRSAPGQKGVKLNWELIWKNWILNANQFTAAKSNRMSSPLIGKHDPDNVIDFKPTVCATCGLDTCLKDHRLDEVAA